MVPLVSLKQLEDDVDTHKLILAAKIREVAVSLRDAERHRHSLQIRASGSKGTPIDLSLNDWDEQNPVFKYLPRAFRELSDIAKLADSLAAFNQ